MNKFRLIGVGTIITGILIGYYFNLTHIHILSGMLIGVGIGWLITGRIGISSGKKQAVRNRID